MPTVMTHLQRVVKLVVPKFLFSCLLVCPAIAIMAQDGNAGINEANTQVRSYFAAGTNLMYAVGAIVGLIGAIKVYNKWNSGDPDTGKVFLRCIVWRRVFIKLTRVSIRQLNSVDLKRNTLGI